MGGDFFDAPKIPFEKGYKKKGYDFLNFDGGYIAYFCDKVQNKKVIFCSHKRNFDLFYIRNKNELIFSDSFYYLVSKLKKATWNLNSISDYFEPSWNHICKYDRTPLKEISKLDTYHYIEITKHTRNIIQKSWKKNTSKVIYTEKNLDDFKTEFYRILDYYLRKIHENNPNVAISLSGGIDTNTIAAEWSKIFPDEKTVFFTFKIDDVTDESRLASFMQSCISNKIKYIPIKLEETNIIDELYSHMDSFVPPPSVYEFIIRKIFL